MLTITLELLVSQNTGLLSLGSRLPCLPPMSSVNSLTGLAGSTLYSSESSNFCAINNTDSELKKFSNILCRLTYYLQFCLSFFNSHKHCFEGQLSKSSQIYLGEPSEIRICDLLLRRQEQYPLF